MRFVTDVETRPPGSTPYMDSIIQSIERIGPTLYGLGPVSDNLCTIDVAFLGEKGFVGWLSRVFIPYHHSIRYVRRPCEGHGIGPSWVFLKSVKCLWKIQDRTHEAQFAARRKWPIDTIIAGQFNYIPIITSHCRHQSTQPSSVIPPPSRSV